MLFDLDSSVTIGCLLAIVVILALTTRAASTTRQEAQAIVTAREKTVRGQGARYARIKESAAQQSLNFRLQLEAIEEKHAERFRLANEECNEKLLTAERNYSQSLDALQADHDQKLNTRMSGLAQKKARDMAAKDSTLASKDDTIASQRAELTRLEHDLQVKRAHSEEMRNVTVKLQAQLSDSGSELSLLKSKHAQALREIHARGRRDNIMTADSSDLVSKHDNVVATLRLEESLLRQAHARELASAKQQHETQLKTREISLMRACVRDLEHAAGVGSSEDRMAWERRVGEWKGQVKQLEREVDEKRTHN